jgi:hypothetical protein
VLAQAKPCASNQALEFLLSLVALYVCVVCTAHLPIK